MNTTLNSNEGFLLGAILSVSFMAGYFIESLMYKIFTFIGVVIFAYIVASTSTPPGSSNAMEHLTAQGLFTLPFLIGAIISFYKTYKKEIEEEEKYLRYQTKIKNSSPIELIQKIDDMLNCVVGVNNEWIKINWLSVTDDEKIIFINKHRATLNKFFPDLQNAAELISLLQRLKRDL